MRQKIESLLRSRRLPVATVLVGSLILNVSLLGLREGVDRAAVSGFPGVFHNVFRLTAAGEVWRPFFSWLVHLDYTHAVIDVLYLALLGTVFERRFGSRKMVGVFLLANWVGSWAAVFLDPHFESLVGSSDGTHGLLAYYCLFEGLGQRLFRFLGVLYLALYGYLLYFAVYALFVGTLPPPLESMPNGGVDHLGGIGIATVWAVVDLARSRRHRQTRKGVPPGRGL